MQAERNEHCVQRAVWLMALFTALAMAGLCYSVIFQVDYPQNMSYLSSPIMSKVFCALGLGSLISLMAFLGLGAVYRKEMDQRRDEWRQLATKVLVFSPRQRFTSAVQEPANVLRGSAAVAPASQSVKSGSKPSRPAMGYFPLARAWHTPE